MNHHKAPRFTSSLRRGFSAACHGFGLSGSAGSRKPLKHSEWLARAVQSAFDFEVWVPCNTHTLSPMGDFHAH